MRILLLLSALAISSTCLAQDEPDENDLSYYTTTTVEQLRTTAMAAYEADCASSLVDMENYASAANSLANIISVALDPYYDASSRARDRVGRRLLNQLVEYERTSNDYRRQRNEAHIMIAECQARNGMNDEAIASYAKALNNLSAEEAELWERARTGLFALIGVE
ncbi:MAG: hypothetical protein AAGN64_10335 [Bacteroidota bacterium]